MKWLSRKIEDTFKLVTVQFRDQLIECVEVTRGTFKGVVFYYGVVRFVTEDDSDTARLQYEYFVLKNPKNKNTDSGDFKNYAGDVLVNLIESERLDDKFISLQDTVNAAD